MPGKKLTRRIGVPAAAVSFGIVAVAGAAVAAMLIFGAGTFSANAAETKPLTVSNTALTSTLYPGGSAGAKGVVHNPNDFPVTVTDVIVKESPAIAVSPSECNGKVNPTGVHGTYGGPTGNVTGWKYHLSTPVVVNAGSAAWVTVPSAVSQDPSGTTTCGVTADIVVVATAGA